MRLCSMGYRLSGYRYDSWLSTQNERTEHEAVSCGEGWNDAFDLYFCQ